MRAWSVLSAEPGARGAAVPALGKQICAVCCGTKRLVEIACPSDCAYLASAREHPAAATLRQHQHDVALLVRFVRDLNERQSQLFFLLATFLLRYNPPELQPLIDEDIAEAAAALAATFETASRGVIYEHQPGVASGRPTRDGAQAAPGRGGQRRRPPPSNATRPSSCGGSKRPREKPRAADPSNRRSFSTCSDGSSGGPTATIARATRPAAPEPSRLIVP